MDGTSFGRYQLLQLLGRGDMGEVWRAYDTETTRTVALKILIEHLAQDDTFKEHFRSEANTAAKLNDPHVIPIHNYGEIDGRLYVDMRLVDGRDLLSIFEAGPMHPARAVHIVEQVASALTVAHDAGMVHRDIKPANILIAKNDYAYLIDFGLAHAAEKTQFAKSEQSINTWAYMAPELFTTGEAEPRSDVYALTCVLYHALRGQRPFPGETLKLQYGGHVRTPRPRPSENRGVPSEFDAVIATGMAVEPHERYQSALDLAYAARTALGAEQRPATPPPTALPRPPHRPHYPGTPQNPGTPAPFTVQRMPPAPPSNVPPRQPPPPIRPAPAPAASQNNRTLIIVAAIVVATIVIATLMLVIAG